MTVFDIALDHQRQRAQRPDGNPYGLTPREIEIARWLGQSLSPRGIAAKLSISHKTVEQHRSRIKAKVGARNQAHLVHIVATLSGMRIPPADFAVIEDFRDAFGPVPRAAQLDIAFAD